MRGCGPQPLRTIARLHGLGSEKPGFDDHKKKIQSQIDSLQQIIDFIDSNVKQSMLLHRPARSPKLLKQCRGFDISKDS
jgi:hypothetical protein